MRVRFALECPTIIHPMVADLVHKFEFQHGSEIIPERGVMADKVVIGRDIVPLSYDVLGKLVRPVSMRPLVCVVEIGFDTCLAQR